MVVLLSKGKVGNRGALLIDQCASIAIPCFNVDDICVQIITMDAYIIINRANMTRKGADMAKQMDWIPAMVFLWI
jgi:hypothetical protein